MRQTKNRSGRRIMKDDKKLELHRAEKPKNTITRKEFFKTIGVSAGVLGLGLAAGRTGLAAGDPKHKKVPMVASTGAASIRKLAQKIRRAIFPYGGIQE
jgi:hypothetical protein